ncbi:esterase-like activity of phytase family protein [uncultured Martelella sp.]|uniref:esterase-like activity of phytase family protein n=1 Tax=uncultured Martelella sp. TaxID=392331 RepID=UPI0029C6136C|nr:esterase-like activity of phytase family protein [uncultured Martelella sp.]
MRVVFAFLALALVAAPAAAASVTVNAVQIEKFAAEKDTDRFGRLQFLGGLKLTSPDPEFQSLSAIRFLPDGTHFIAVADTGEWVDGTVTRDASGALSGLADVTVTPMKNARGVHAGKSGMDAESLAIQDDHLYVGFEGRHRIDSYPLSGHDQANASPGPDFLIPTYELRRNGSFEALATAPDGRMVVIAEKSIDTAGNLFAAVIRGPDRGIFKVVKREGYDVTDAAFLPDGDLLVLERRFSLLSGVAMRIRRLPGDAVRPGSTVDGPTIMQAYGGTHRIDNMEGMDVVRSDDGTLHIILVSDDNDSPLQNTLMLEFRLID